MSFLWSFRIKGINPAIPAIFADMDLYKGSYVSKKYEFAYSSENRIAGRSGKLTEAFAMALCRAKQIKNGANVDGYGYNVYNDGHSFAEFTNSGIFEGNDIGKGEVYCVAFNRYDGRFTAQKAGSSVNYKDTETIAALHLSLWPMYLHESNDFAEKFEQFCTALDSDLLKSYACYLADCAYVLTTTTSSHAAVIKVDDTKDALLLNETKMDKPENKVANIVAGQFQKFTILNGGLGTTGQDRYMATADFIGKYAFRTDALSPEEQALVPVLDEKYIVGETLINICEHIQKTTNKSRPIRNILLRGEPGTGKTEMYVGIAAACNLPLYTFAANAMTEPYDLFGQFVPVDENGNQIGDKMPIDNILSGMPTAEDISFDPVNSYQRITGISKPDASPTDCMSAMFNLAQKSININTNNDGKQKFKFVPGQLIYAMKNGGVWGFDEVTLPQNSGVVPALNPAMDGTQSITLPTGEIVKRHPACVFVGTTNIDLEGCRRMNQAWQDRCQLIIDVEEPSDEELIARVKAMTDYDDVNDSNIDLRLFVQVYKELKELAKKKRLDDGQIGPRKLSDWVMSTMITGDPVKSAKWTIIPGATADYRGIAELEEKVGNYF